MFLILSWMFVGAVVGWLAGKSMEGNGYGRSMDVVMGIGGGVISGYVAGIAGFVGVTGTVFSSFAAIAGGALLTTLVALCNGRRLYSRSI